MATALAYAYETYKVDIWKNEAGDGYWASCDMPNGGANTVGDTIQEVCANMYEAMELYLEDYPQINNFLLTFEERN
ncbi:MAG: type II toxin-antitoxin system HicB family antitoxin [Defluviitaleaceae bacterium]|nr:type II toxin-antitoxin system HicB family antitoxin [Defluviitaleaceae bacterium]